MGRGALNFIDLCGVHHAVYKGNTEDERLLLAIGFKKDKNGDFSIKINSPSGIKKKLVLPDGEETEFFESSISIG
jgi:hypothetical protein